MRPTELETRLTIALLELAANEFSNHTCNDLPDHIRSLFNKEDWDELSWDYHVWNGDREEFRPGHPVQCDSAWMSYLANRLKSLL